MRFQNIWILILFKGAILSGFDIELIAKTDGVLSSATLKNFSTLFHLDSFIETGTYSGSTTLEASKVFKEIHSIEIFEPLYREAKNRLAPYPNIALYLGDTVSDLKRLIQNSSPKRLYWLDAHSSGEGTGGIPGFNPVLDELEQIFSQEGELDSVILIDDLRGMCHCDSRGNLPLRLIIHQIKKQDKNLQFYSLGDIGIIFNEKIYPSLSISEIVKMSSISRFFDPNCESEEVLEELIDAEMFIGSYNDQNLETERFFALSNWVDRNNLGGEVIYLLWHSLREIENDQVSSAVKNLELISKSFYAHWRMDAYLVKALILDGQIERARGYFNRKLTKYNQRYPKIIQKILSNLLEIITE